MGYKETEEFINKLRIIVYGLLAVPLLIFIIIYLRSNKGEDIEPLIDQNLIHPIVGIFVTIILAFIISAYLYFRKKIKIIRNEPNLINKFMGYYKTSIVKFSLFEVSLVLSLVGLLITGHKIFVATFLIMIFIYSLENPSIRKLTHHLKLTKDEKDQLLKHAE